MSAGFFEGPPDLAAKVVSPTDAWQDVESKVAMWLEHGCLSCWIIDPRTRRIVIHARDSRITSLKPPEKLQDPVLPGFRVPVLAVFAR